MPKLIIILFSIFILSISCSNAVEDQTDSGTPSSQSGSGSNDSPSGGSDSDSSAFSLTKGEMINATDAANKEILSFFVGKTVVLKLVPSEIKSSQSSDHSMAKILGYYCKDESCYIKIDLISIGKVDITINGDYIFTINIKEEASSGGPVVPVHVCGDGTKDPGEACDDGNTAPGDGCSATCQLEPSVCGDGFVEAGEECDNGAHVGTNGCSSSCTIEDGYACSGEPSVCSCDSVNHYVNYPDNTCTMADIVVTSGDDLATGDPTKIAQVIILVIHDCTLKDAVAKADDGTILSTPIIIGFADGVDTVTLTEGEVALPVNKEIAIIGNDTSNTLVTRSETAATNFRIFKVNAYDADVLCLANIDETTCTNDTSCSWDTDANNCRYNTELTQATFKNLNITNGHADDGISGNDRC